MKDRIAEALASTGLSQTEVARRLKKSKGIVTQWLNGTVKSLKAETAQDLQDLTGYSSGWLATGQGEKRIQFMMANSDGRMTLHEATLLPSSDTAPLLYSPLPIEMEGNPDYPAVRRVAVKAQAGITGYAVENCEDSAPIVFRADWYKSKGYRPERLLALRVAGESMIPSLWPGDLIVVNTESTTPKDGNPYLVAYYGEITVKRLVMDAGQWWLTSDNPDQRRHARKLCDDSTVLIGEVIYKQSERV